MPVSHIRAKVRASRQRRRAKSNKKKPLPAVPMEEPGVRPPQELRARPVPYLPRKPADRSVIFESDESDESDEADHTTWTSEGEEANVEDTVEVVPALCLLLSDDAKYAAPATLPLELLAEASMKVNEAAKALQEVCVAFNERTLLEAKSKYHYSSRLPRRSTLKSQLAITNADCRSFFSSLDRLTELDQLRQAVINLHSAFTSNALEVVRQGQWSPRKQGVKRICRKPAPLLTEKERAEILKQSTATVATSVADSWLDSRAFRMSLASGLCPFPTIAGLHTMEVDELTEEARERAESDALMRALGVRPFHPLQEVPSPRLMANRKSPIDLHTLLPTSTRRGTFGEVFDLDCCSSETAASSGRGDDETTSRTSSSASSYSQNGTEGSSTSESELPEIDIGLCANFAMPFLPPDGLSKGANAISHANRVDYYLSPYVDLPVSPKTATAKRMPRGRSMSFDDTDDEASDEEGIYEPPDNSKAFRDRLASAPDVFLIDPAKQTVGRYTIDAAPHGLMERKGSLQAQTIVSQKPARPKRHHDRPSPTSSPSREDNAENHFSAPSPLSASFDTINWSFPLGSIRYYSSDDDDDRELLIPERRRQTNTPVTALASESTTPVARSAESGLMPGIQNKEDDIVNATHTSTTPPVQAHFRVKQSSHSVLAGDSGIVGRVVLPAARATAVEDSISADSRESLNAKHATKNKGTPTLPSITLLRSRLEFPVFHERTDSIPRQKGGTKMTRRRPSVIVAGQICDVLETPTDIAANLASLTPSPPVGSSVATQVEDGKIKRNRSGQSQFPSTTRGVRRPYKATPYPSPTRRSAIIALSKSEKDPIEEEEVEEIDDLHHEGDEDEGDGRAQILQIRVQRVSTTADSPIRTGSADRSRPAWWKEMSPGRSAEDDTSKKSPLAK